MASVALGQARQFSLSVFYSLPPSFPFACTGGSPLRTTSPFRNRECERLPPGQHGLAGPLDSHPAVLVASLLGHLDDGVGESHVDAEGHDEEGQGGDEGVLPVLNRRLLLELLVDVSARKGEKGAQRKLETESGRERRSVREGKRVLSAHCSDADVRENDSYPAMSRALMFPSVPKRVRGRRRVSRWECLSIGLPFTQIELARRPLRGSPTHLRPCRAC